ncbi:hypothetical protein BpHYR1_044426 [Brachionus plicatilis]|uniref:Uncharacterized protein n=1 Tax=Brachionus plicatilis TaxID=10195 RepID=A0A3M7Q9Y0_BRAPC|nr:hypothetical protein BpHYR1_044426 [Brachionus plicatilis]
MSEYFLINRINFIKKLKKTIRNDSFIISIFLSTLQTTKFTPLNLNDFKCGRYIQVHNSSRYTFGLFQANNGTNKRTKIERIINDFILLQIRIKIAMENKITI